MRATLRHAVAHVNVSGSGPPRGVKRERSRTALGLALDRTAGRCPAVEADVEVRHVREAHLAQDVRGEGRALPTGTVHDDAFRGVDLAGVIVRGRVEPEFEHPPGHVRRAGNEPELPPLADGAEWD